MDRLIEEKKLFKEIFYFHLYFLLCSLPAGNGEKCLNSGFRPQKAYFDERNYTFPVNPMRGFILRLILRPFFLEIITLK